MTRAALFMLYLKYVVFGWQSQWRQVSRYGGKLAKNLLLLLYKQPVVLLSGGTLS